MEKTIEVQDITFAYGSMPVLDKIDFSIHRGDFAAIIGANGTGKSTLLKLLLGELIPARGRVLLFGEDTRRFKDWSRLGYVPQNGISGAASFPATALEVVLASLYPRIGLMRLPKKVHTEQARQALDRVGMADYAGRLIGELSGGQQQRVMLAKVLVSDPELMLLDEPTTGIDSESADALYRLLADFNKQLGLTILMVTHDIGRAHHYLNRVLCLEEGSMVELASDQLEDELRHKHKHPPVGHIHGGEASAHGDL